MWIVFKITIESLFQDKNKRGFGCGIKDFSFTYDGSNPFSAKKSIKAKLTIFASSFDELLKSRIGTYKITTHGPQDLTVTRTATREYKYADLALKTGKMPQNKDIETSAKCQEIAQINDNLEKLNFRLKAVIGWARPNGSHSLFTTTSESTGRNVMDAINESYVTLNLTPTIHEFDIDEMGRVTFTINYLAYILDLVQL